MFRIVIERNGKRDELDDRPLTIVEAQRRASQAACSLKQHDGTPTKAFVYAGLDMVYQVNVP